MTELFAIMPIKNEAHRYLESVLKELRPLVDRLFVYDDQSDDDSVGVCKAVGADAVVRRSDDVPSFLAHEGRFRQGLWDTFQATFNPKEGDWILAIDADEYLVAGPGHPLLNKVRVKMYLKEADNAGYHSVKMEVPETFGLDADRHPLVRVDGFWGGVGGPRLFRWYPGGVFRDKAMGCGSEPTYVTNLNMLQQNHMQLLHVGYADPADCAPKHQRYSSLLDHGHNSSHVESIITPPTLNRWMGVAPKIYKGVKDVSW